MEGKYIIIWKKYLPLIKILLKKSIQKQQILNLNRHEFESTGDRELSGYTFNLEIISGKVANDISGTAVARDLFKILNDDSEIRVFLKTRNTKISLGKKFDLNLVAKGISY